MVKPRQLRPDDLDALYAISLATGLAGADAAHLYADPRMVGHIYSAPYALLAPELALVFEDENGVAGFAVGAIDTVAWEQRLERDWWPTLRSRYPDPAGTPPNAWTPDQRRAFMIHHPERTPSAITRAYPAHLHANLLPRAQGRGVGSTLLHAWLELARQRGAPAVHVGVNRENERAARFWGRHEFAELAAGERAAGRTLWMGRALGC